MINLFKSCFCPPQNNNSVNNRNTLIIVTSNKSLLDFNQVTQKRSNLSPASQESDRKVTIPVSEIFTTSDNISPDTTITYSPQQQAEQRNKRLKKNIQTYKSKEKRQQEQKARIALIKKSIEEKANINGNVFQHTSELEENFKKLNSQSK